MCITSIYNVVDPRVTEKNFKFARSHKLPFFYVSASDGTNVVRVRNFSDHCFTYMYIFFILYSKVFKDAIRAGLAYKESTQDIVDHIMEELRVSYELCLHAPYS